MGALTLIREAEAAGLRLRVDGEKLKIAGPKSAGMIAERLLDAKPLIIAALQSQAIAAEYARLAQALDADDHLRLEERAAALEFDGNLDRTDAEALALAEIAITVQPKQADVVVRFFDGQMIVIPQDKAPMDWKTPF